MTIRENRVPRSICAILAGAVLSSVISAALVIATAKAGISPGVSPLVVLIGWVACGAALPADRLKPFLALLQVTGSGGAAVSAGLIFTAPILQVAARLMGEPIPSVDVPTTLGACIAGSLLGWGFVGLAAQRFLTDPRLPAPEAVACDRLIRTAVQNPDQRPPIGLSLVPALISGFLVQLLVSWKWLLDTATTTSIPLPNFSRANLHFAIPISPLFLGIGALLTFPTALLVFLGGVVNSLTKAYSAEFQLANETYRWVGGAAMIVAVLYSLIHYLISGRRQLGTESRSGSFTRTEEPPNQSQLENGTDASLLDLSPGMLWGLRSAIAAGGLLLCGLLFRTSLPVSQALVLGGISLVLVGLLSGLGGLLSLQVGASASPISGTVFMAMLVLSLVSLGLAQTGFVAIATLQPVLVASCVAIAAANDSSQDYKTMQLNGYVVSSAYIPQLVGCMAGALIVPLSLWVAHEAFELGSEELPCPQASFFGMVLTSLFDPGRGIPWGPVGCGMTLGCGAVAMEMVGRRRGMILSSLAFAVGIYLPAEMGIGILLGNLARAIATGSFQRSSHRGILTAAGLIAGDGLFSLAAGILIVCQVDLSRLEASAPLASVWGGMALLLLLALLAFAYRDGRKSKS